MSEKGKLIVFEGIDGCGKSVQYQRLCDRLTAAGRDFRRVRFPRYDNPSATLVKMYLGGEFGDDPSAVNAYAASTFYAVDRYASYMTDDWGRHYNNGGLVLMDRYTTSNAVHQGSKLPEEQLPEFFDWLYDLEYHRLGLPRPDLVLYLDVDVPTSLERMAQRRAADGSQADIHEKDAGYLEKCLELGHRAAAHYGWQVIDFRRDGELLSIEDKSDLIYCTVKEALGLD